MKEINIESKYSNIFKFVKNDLLNSKGIHSNCAKLCEEIFAHMHELYNTPSGQALIELLGSDDDSKVEQLERISSLSDERENLEYVSVVDILINYSEIPSYLCGSDQDYANLYKLIDESEGPYSLSKAFLDDLKIDKHDSH